MPPIFDRSRDTPAPTAIALDDIEAQFNQISQNALAAKESAVGITGSEFDKAIAGLTSEIGGQSQAQLIGQLINDPGLPGLALEDPVQQGPAGGFAAAIMAGLGDQRSLERLGARQRERDQVVRQNVLLRQEDARKTKAERDATIARGLAFIQQKRNEEISNAKLKFDMEMTAARDAFNEVMGIGNQFWQAQQAARGKESLNLQSRQLQETVRSNQAREGVARDQLSATNKTNALMESQISQKITDGVWSELNDPAWLKEQETLIANGQKSWEKLQAEIEFMIERAGGVNEGAAIGRMLPEDHARLWSLIQNGAIGDMMTKAQMRFNTQGRPKTSTEKVMGFFKQNFKPGGFAGPGQVDLGVSLGALGSSFGRGVNSLREGVHSTGAAIGQAPEGVRAGVSAQMAGAGQAVDSFGQSLGRIDDALQTGVEGIGAGMGVISDAAQNDLDRIEALGTGAGRFGREAGFAAQGAADMASSVVVSGVNEVRNRTQEALGFAQETFNRASQLPGAFAMSAEEVVGQFGVDVGRAAVSAELQNTFDRMSPAAQQSYIRIQEEKRKLYDIYNPVVGQMEIGVQAQMEGLQRAVGQLMAGKSQKERVLGFDPGAEIGTAEFFAERERAAHEANLLERSGANDELPLILRRGELLDFPENYSEIGPQGSRLRTTDTRAENIRRQEIQRRSR